LTPHRELGLKVRKEAMTTALFNSKANITMKNMTTQYQDRKTDQQNNLEKQILYVFHGILKSIFIFFGISVSYYSSKLTVLKKKRRYK